MKSTDAQICRLCGEIAEAPDLDATLKVLARNITKIMGVKACTVRLLNEKKQTLEIAAAYGLSKSYLQKGPVKISEHPVDREVLEGRVISTKDITKERHVLYLDEARREGIKSVLSIPLPSGKRVLGVVRIYTDKPRSFSKEEVRLLRDFAAVGGILLEKAGIWEEMRALVKISRSVSSSLSVDEVLQMIVENSARTLGMKGASLRLLDEARKKLEIKAAYGLSRSYLEKGPVEVGKSSVDRDCLQCRIVTVKNVRKDRRLQYPEELTREGIMALISLPLIVRGSAIGVLRVYADAPYSFTESERDFLSALACQGAVAIENARLFEHIKNEYRDLARDVWKWYDWGERFPKI